MHCTRCGYEFEKQPKFCPECGARQAVRETGPVDPSWASRQTDDTDNRLDPVQRQAYQAARTFYQPQPGYNERNMPDSARQDQLHGQRLAYVRQDYNPGRDGTFRQSSVRQNGYPGAQPDTRQKPSATGMIVFSIINIICFGLGISLILGTIALVFSIMSSGEKTVEQAVDKLNIARILNVIGLVFILIQLIIIFVIIAAALLYSYRVF